MALTTPSSSETRAQRPTQTNERWRRARTSVTQQLPAVVPGGAKPLQVRDPTATDGEGPPVLQPMTAARLCTAVCVARGRSSNLSFERRYAARCERAWLAAT